MSEASKPADGGESFLSRWSRRKIEEKAADKAVVSSVDGDIQAPNSSIGGPSGAKMAGTPLPERTLPSETEQKAPLPAIDSLTVDADFSPFMARDVDPALRNQAMKKLFTDPHYQFENMDKLDIYIDDYSKSDPIPLEILKKMYQSRALSIFDDEEDDEKEKHAKPNDADTTPPVSADADNSPALPESCAESPALGNDQVTSIAPESLPPDANRPQ